MLKKRSRVVGGTSKPAASPPVSDHHLPPIVRSSSSSSFFSPARLFSFFSDLELPREPGNTISILETKPPSSSKNTSFASPAINPRLGIADALREEDGSSAMAAGAGDAVASVLFGSKLRRVLPADPAAFPFEFGIKTKGLLLPLQPSLPSSSAAAPAAAPAPALSSSARELGRSLSAREMELSEEYTCVISHRGPNPRTTRIFDGRIVEFESSGAADDRELDGAARPAREGRSMMEEEMMMQKVDR